MHFNLEPTPWSATRRNDPPDPLAPQNADESPADGKFMTVIDTATALDPVSDTGSATGSGQGADEPPGLNPTCRPHRAHVLAGSLAAMAICATAVAAVGAPRAAEARKVDIVMLGDSQLSFGSGPAFENFFSDFSKRCAGLGLDEDVLAMVDDMRVGIMGVRSTGVHSWVAKSRRGKRMVCERDPAPNSLVNASAYGALRFGNKWVQIGSSRHHRFCRSRQSPLQVMLSEKLYRPKLAIFHFLGLNAYRWRNPANARKDIAALVAQIPKETRCVFFTTIPTYRRSLNKPRWIAQRHLKAELARTGNRCVFIPGLTKKTARTFEGRSKYFYTKRGRVRDPYHANPAGSERFIQIRGQDFCAAIVKALAN